MGKVHKTFRLDADIMAEVESWAEAHGMRQGEAVERLLADGLRYQQDRQEEPPRASERPQEATGDGGQAETHNDDLRAVCELLRASNADLRAEVSRLWAQLATKDEQITRAHELADQSQRLHAAEVARALPPEGGTTGGLRGRLASLFGRR